MPKTPTRFAGPDTFVSQQSSRGLPGWALYALASFTLAALTGLVGWLAHRGMRLIWALVVALTGVGALAGVVSLLQARRAKHLHATK